jgi:hypothetical protein
MRELMRQQEIARVRVKKTGGVLIHHDEVEPIRAPKERLRAWSSAQPVSTAHLLKYLPVPDARPIDFRTRPVTPRN